MTGWKPTPLISWVTLSWTAIEEVSLFERLKRHVAETFEETQELSKRGRDFRLPFPPPAQMLARPLTWLNTSKFEAAAALNLTQHEVAEDRVTTKKFLLDCLAACSDAQM